jgi:hypothetical protein
MPSVQESQTGVPNQRRRWVTLLFRVLGGVLGVLVIAVAPIAHAPEGAIWPRWVVVVSLVGSGVYFLYFALTGRSNLVSALLRRLR